MTEPDPTPDPTRDPATVVEAARTLWTAWQPGDGTKYVVRIYTITYGPDLADRVLLINRVGETVAFQYPTAEYRRGREVRLWSRKRARREGLGRWWAAAGQLLAALSALEPPARDPEESEAEFAHDGGTPATPGWPGTVSQQPSAKYL